MWQSIAGRRYRIQRSDDLLQWTTLEDGSGPVVVDAAGETATWMIPITSPLDRQFYRIEVLPQ